MAAPERFAGAEDQLHTAATAMTGLTDFGNPDEYLPGLRRLLAALDNGPRFTPRGREFTFGSLLGTLIARLQTERGWRDHPECLAQPICRPLIITGVPRTGTTALHKLLSMDPQFQGMERWLTATPMPRPPRDTWNSNPHYQATVAGLRAFFEAAPEMKAAHDMVADEVDECLEVLKQNFCSNMFGSSLRVPDYDAWWVEQDEAPSYRRYAKVLRLIGAREPDKPWLLKNPGHIHHLDALLEIFPDACVVQTHRDPVKSLPSLCSVLVMARRISEGEGVDLHEIGRREIDNWNRAVKRAMEVRARSQEHFYDVHHKDFHADPMRVVAQIYERFGLNLSLQAEQRMRDWIRNNPEGKHGSHSYTLEQFGLSAAQIRERFADYIRQYGLG